MHKNEISHRDIKLDNILLDRYYVSKLTDFGFAAETARKVGERIEGETKYLDYTLIITKTHCGTAWYMAPEIVQETEEVKGYDSKKCDFYSLGVCTFELLNRRLPIDQNLKALQRLPKQLKKQFDWNKEVEKKLSEEAKVFLNKTLEPDPKKRASGDELKADAWIKSYRHNPYPYQND